MKREKNENIKVKNIEKVFLVLVWLIRVKSRDENYLNKEAL